MLDFGGADQVIAPVLFEIDEQSRKTVWSENFKTAEDSFLLRSLIQTDHLLVGAP